MITIPCGCMAAKEPNSNSSRSYKPGLDSERGKNIQWLFRSYMQFFL